MISDKNRPNDRNIQLIDEILPSSLALPQIPIAIWTGWALGGQHAVDCRMLLPRHRIHCLFDSIIYPIHEASLVEGMLAWRDYYFLGFLIVTETNGATLIVQATAYFFMDVLCLLLFHVDVLTRSILRLLLVE